MASASLTIDGVNVSKVYGPYAAASGVNFSGDFGKLAAGTHTYVITAIDTAGNTSTYTGTFTVAGQPRPDHRRRVRLPASGVMSWNAVDSDGVASATLKVDGASVSKVYGPYAAASGVNFSGDFGTLAAGSHSYVITATDKLGNSSTYNGTFTVAGTTNAGPTIGGVYVLPASGVMSWNAADPDGVASATLKVDGASVSKVYGPYAAASGVNFSGQFGTLAAGSHTYVITATDKLGNSSTYNGQLHRGRHNQPRPGHRRRVRPAGQRHDELERGRFRRRGQLHAQGRRRERLEGVRPLRGRLGRELLRRSSARWRPATTATSSPPRTSWATPRPPPATSPWPARPTPARPSAACTSWRPAA